MARDFTLSLSADFISHVKTRKLVRLLGHDETAPLSLLRFWAWAAEFAPDGDLSGIDVPEIEDGAGWRGDGGVFFQSLVSAGFVDSDDTGRRIHKWMLPGRTGYALKQADLDRAKWRERKAAYGPAWPGVRAAIVQRDGGVCVTVGCPSTEPVEVHHIRPVRLFGGDHESANHPSNLITLCRTCHARADAEIRRKERS